MWCYEPLLPVAHTHIATHTEKKYIILSSKIKRSHSKGNNINKGHSVHAPSGRQQKTKGEKNITHLGLNTSVFMRICVYVCVVSFGKTSCTCTPGKTSMKVSSQHTYIGSLYISMGVCECVDMDMCVWLCVIIALMCTHVCVLTLWSVG